MILQVIRKRSKELIPKMNQSLKRAIPLQESIEKNKILPSKYRKTRQFVAQILFLSILFIFFSKLYYSKVKTLASFYKNKYNNFDAT